MNKLLAGIEAKREAIVTGRPPTLEADLPAELERPVAERLAQAAEEDVVRRLWRKDGTLWAPAGTPELEDRLGWLTIADKLLEDLPDDQGLRARGVRADGLTDVVLLGMGGSSLAPEVFRRSNPPAEGALRLHVLDSTEPLQVEAVAAAIDLATTLFIVSSKSGGTIEPNALLAYFRGLQPDAQPLRRHHRPRHVDGAAGRARGLPHDVPLRSRDRRALLGAVALRHRPGRAGRRRRRGGAGGRPGRGGELPPARGQLGPVARAPRSASWRCAGATSSRSSSTRRSARSGCGPSSSSPSRPASRAAASCRSPTSRWSTRRPTAHDRVFLHLRDADAPDPRHAEAVAALAAAGPPDDHADRGRGRRPRADLLPLGVRDRGRRLGAGDQPVRPAQRPGGEGQHGQGARRRARPQELEDGSLDELLDGLAAAGLPRDHGLPALRRRGRRRGRASCARRSSSATASRPRSATARASCTPPASSTRAGPPRGASSSSCTTRTRTPRCPGQPYSFRTLIDAQADGDLQTLRGHGLPAVRVRLPAGDLAGAITRLQEQI